MEINSGTANVNGTTIYYEHAGRGRAVVLIHGFSLDCRMWDDQFELLAGQYHVIRYDLRGFGRSAAASSEPYAPVEDLGALLEFLQIEHATVVGLSFGGGIAVDFALAFPSITDAVVTADAALTGYPWPRGRPAAKPATTAATEGVDAAKRSWLASELFIPAFEQAAVSARLEDYVNDYSGWHWLNENPITIPETPAIERLESIRCPSLVIVGERDTIDFREIAEILTKRIPDSKRCVIPRVGHMSNMEDPQAFNRALLEFLS